MAHIKLIHAFVGRGALVLLLSCALSGFFTYLLVRRLTGSEGAALCAGLAYAIAPFRAEAGTPQQVVDVGADVSHSESESDRHHVACEGGGVLAQ